MKSFGYLKVLLDIGFSLKVQLLPTFHIKSEQPIYFVQDISKTNFDYAFKQKVRTINKLIDFISDKLWGLKVTP